MKKRLLALLLAVALVAAMVPLGASAASVKFTDVKAGAYYEKAVAWAVENKVTAGTTPTTFSPDKPCTRAEAVSFLYRYVRQDTPYPTDDLKCQFKDVASADYFYTPVLWAQYAKVTAGTTETAFSPNKNCTRAEIVSFLWRAAGRPTPKTTVNPFKDVKASDYYYDAVLWAVGENITAGTTPTTFSPTSACKRCEIVSFLHRNATEKNVPGSEDKLTKGSMVLLSAVDLVHSQFGTSMVNFIDVYSYSPERRAYEILRADHPTGETGLGVYDHMLVSPSGQVLLSVNNNEDFYQTRNGYASIAFVKAGTDEVLDWGDSIVSTRKEDPQEDGTIWVSYQYNNPKGAYDIRLTTYDKTGKKLTSFKMDEKKLTDWYNAVKDNSETLTLPEFAAQRYGVDFAMYTAPQDINDPGVKAPVNGMFERDPKTGHYLSDNTLGVVVTDTATGFTVKSKEGKLLGEIVMKDKDKDTYVTVAGNTLVVWESYSLTFTTGTYSQGLRAYHLTV